MLLFFTYSIHAGRFNRRFSFQAREVFLYHGGQHLFIFSVIIIFITSVWINLRTNMCTHLKQNSSCHNYDNHIVPSTGLTPSRDIWRGTTHRYQVNDLFAFICRLFHDDLSSIIRIHDIKCLY